MANSSRPTGRRNPATFGDVAAAAIRAVPAGRVATYGQIARLAGNPRAARIVVWLLNSSWKTRDLPWHRIINAQGRIALKGEGLKQQRRLLRKEGVAVAPDGRVDLARFGWQPRAQQTKAGPRRTAKDRPRKEKR
jgi:methylated-DNA-protein-cysteine methyltransferase related protein